MRLEVVATLFTLAHSLTCYVQHCQFLPSPFPCQPCCGFSGTRGHSRCCHNSTSWSSSVIFHLAQGTIFLTFVAMFVAKYAASGW